MGDGRFAEPTIPASAFVDGQPSFGEDSVSAARLTSVELRGKRPVRTGNGVAKSPRRGENSMITYAKLIGAFGLIVTIAAAPSYADGRDHGRRASGRSRHSVVVGRAVPRHVAPRVVVPAVPYRQHYYRPYRPGVGFGLYFDHYGAYGGYPYGYGYPAYGYGHPAYGYGYPAYGYGYPTYGYGYPAYGYSRPGYVGRPYGGVRIDIPQRDAEVHVDGYYVGTANDFDGVFQHLNLEAGPHRIEIRAPGYEPLSFEVNVEPGRTITYRASMQPSRP
jgi:hypothetical protein